MTPVPVTVLAGFLGAGKTTLLNTILHADHGLRIAALISDFGAIERDGVGNEVIALTNGCTCQIVYGDLLRAALDVLARPNPPEHVLIEASGVADPAALAALFRFSDLRALLRLDSVIALVDAAHATHPRHAALLHDQLFTADLVLLNKIDLVDEVERARLKGWIRGIVPRARVVETSYGAVLCEVVLGAGRYHMTLDLLAPSGTCAIRPRAHGDMFGSWIYQTQRPFLFEHLRCAFLDLPATIVRAKGQLAIAESPDRQFELQLVGSQIALKAGAPWAAQSPHTQLALVGPLDTLDAADLSRRFEACLTNGTSQALVGIAWTGIRTAWQL